MSFDTFTAGTEPGALRNKNEIKLLICYILSSIKPGLSKNDIIQILQNNSFANYFDASNAFSDLLINENIKCDDSDSKIYTATNSGRMISEQLDISLPISIRERALSAALKATTKIKIEKENSVNIEEINNGFSVTCNISGGDINLMSLSIYVPDMLQANMVKRNFHKDPQNVYNCLLGLLTNNQDLINEALNSNENKAD